MLFPQTNNWQQYGTIQPAMEAEQCKIVLTLSKTMSLHKQSTPIKTIDGKIKRPARQEIETSLHIVEDSTFQPGE
jgi:hypothetical protein